LIVDAYALSIAATLSVSLVGLSWDMEPLTGSGVQPSPTVRANVGRQRPTRDLLPDRLTCHRQSSLKPLVVL
jgi:hypothetical protein